MRLATHELVVYFHNSKMVCSKHTEKAVIILQLVAVLVGESHSFQPHLGAQQVMTSDLGSSEIALSLVTNQIMLLKIINESSAICSLRKYSLIDVSL